MTQKIDPKLATDLDAKRLKATQDEIRRKAEDEAKEQAEKARLEALALAWEKAMKRTFKGIFRHSDRKRFLGVGQ